LIHKETIKKQYQDDHTGDLFFDIPYMISDRSHITPLQVGDVVFTGTPRGVGAVSRKFLKDGDVVSTSFEGLGELHNKCVRVTDHPWTQEMAEALSKFSQSRISSLAMTDVCYCRQ
jgi:hypothetical protein